MIIHMIDSLSDHRITLRRYCFGISSSAGKMASRKARNISWHPRATKHPHGPVTAMHRALDCSRRRTSARHATMRGKVLAGNRDGNYGAAFFLDASAPETFTIGAT